MKRSWLVIGLMVFLISSCKKQDNTDPPLQPPAAQPTPPGPPTPPPANLNLEIYTDDLQSGGAFEYPGSGNQDLAFNETSNPAVGTKCMRYAWTGGDTVTPVVQHVFVGVDLMHVGNLVNYASTPGKDLRSKGFTRVTFDARGGLGANVVLKIEVSDDGLQSTPAPCLVLSTSGTDDDSTPGNIASPCTNHAMLLSSWQSYSLPLTQADQASVKDYFKATFIYKLDPVTTGTGGTVFFDQILYQP